MQVAIAKQGCKEKISLDAAREITNSTTKVL